MIKLITVGNLKEDYWKKAQQEYVKRLQKYGHVEIIEINEGKDHNFEVVLKQEKEKILKYLQPKDYVITLEIEGKQFTSYQLSKQMDQWLMQYSNLTFIIGGSYGLDPEIKKRANVSLSFGLLTFPHQMFRIMFLEQLYRSFKIMHNEAYHK